MMSRMLALAAAALTVQAAAAPADEPPKPPVGHDVPKAEKHLPLAPEE